MSFERETNRHNYVESKSSKTDLCFFFTGFLTPKDDDFSETNNFNIEHVHFALRVRTNSR